MTPALLRQTARTVLNENCQRLIQHRHQFLPVRIYIIEEIDGALVTETSPDLACRLMVNTVSECIREHMIERGCSIQAVLTAGPALASSGRLVVLVTADSIYHAYQIYRYFCQRGDDLILEETIDSDSRFDWLAPSDPALHFFDNVRHTMKATQ